MSNPSQKFTASNSATSDNGVTELDFLVVDGRDFLQHPLGSLWHLNFFGSLRARRGGHTVERFRTQKTAALLAILALKGAQARETLCEALWPDAAPEAARNSLSAALSSLRKELGDDQICADRFNVSLAPGAFSTDVAQFNEALRQQNLPVPSSFTVATFCRASTKKRCSA
jgi:hypothetical protein